MKPNLSFSRVFLTSSTVLFAFACSTAITFGREDEKPAPTATFSGDDAKKVQQMLFEGKAAEVVTLLENHPAVKAKQRAAEIPFALALLRTGREREAVTISYRYKRTTENDIAALELVGYVLFSGAQYDQAKAYFKLANLYNTDEKHIEPAFNLVRCDAFMKLDDASAAALQAFESQRDLLPRGMFDDSVGRLAVKRAEQNITKNIYDDKTIELLKKAVVHLPNDVAIPNMLAGVLIQRGDYADAEEVLANMEREFDNNLELVQAQRALIQEKKGNLEQAMRLAGDAITLSKRKLVPALLVYARCALQLEKYDDARRPLDDAINNAPMSLEARVLMSKYLFVRLSQTSEQKSRNEFMDQIEKHLRLGINSDPMAVEPFELLVKLYETWGDKKKPELAVAQKDLSTRIQVRALQEKQKKP